VLTIRTRLTLWYAAMLATILVGVAFFVVWRLRTDLVHGVDAALSSRAQQWRLSLEDPQTPKEKLDIEEVAIAAAAKGARKGTVTQVLTPGGAVIRSVGDRVRPLWRNGPLDRPYTIGTNSGGYRAMAVPLQRSGDVLVVADATLPLEQATRRLVLLLAIAIPAGIALSVAGGYLLARRALGPIDRMSLEAAAIGADRLDARLDVPRLEDEVGRLARTLNGMLDRLQRAIVEQKRFTGDASHELRTPLSIMQSEIDVALRSHETPAGIRPVLASLREEVVRMGRIVESLLTLAQADEGRLELAPLEVNVTEVARHVATRFGSHVTVEGNGNHSTAWADPTRLDQLLTNLIDNAVKYGDGSPVRVGVRSDERDIAVDVADKGPGIAQSELDHVFDRFYRVDEARSAGGAGLGLAICRAIVDAHHGEITARSVPNGGSVFSFRLPRRP
jgi:two-component system OmpR family sensor kinase